MENKRSVFRNIILLRKVIILFLALCVVPRAFAQFTNNINIGSAQQNTNPGTTYNPWVVIAMSNDMLNAYCTGNTAATVAPPAGAPQAPVAIGQNAILLPNPYWSWNAGSYLSCYPFNTIYTAPPAVSNFTNCTMTIRRFFNICSNTNQQVTFNFSVRCDDGVNSIVLDGGAVTLFGGPPQAAMAVPVGISTTLTLAPGVHTIDVVCSDWEDVNGVYFNIAGVGQRQWNPFGVSITGTVSTAGNVLLNSANPSVNAITSTADTICVNATATYSNTTPGGTWGSTNTGVATITAGGVATGIAPGNTVITYTIQQGNCVAQATRNLTVINCCEDSCNWSLTGNSFIQPFNFIGPKNNADFKIRTNNTQRMVVSAAGNVGIGTPAPAKLLHVNGEARIGVLPPASPNESVVFANASGDLRALAATGNTNHYLSGNGTWQALPPGGGTIGADQGLTIDGNGNAVLGDVCRRGSGNGLFLEHRIIHMNDFNLYFNSPSEGKLFMGYSLNPFDGCRDLYTRLEISSAGISGAVNDYLSPNASTSGLRFTDLTARHRTVDNKYKGVLSLDEDGDVIWVNTCCEKGGGIDPQDLKTIMDRLDKLEKEVKESKAEATTLRTQLTQMDVLLTRTNSIVLNQNVPNPFAENTVITYYIPSSFRKAQLVFNTVQGETIKTIDIQAPGKGQVNVFASDLSSGLYFYTLVVDGKQKERKKMIRQ